MHVVDLILIGVYVAVMIGMGAFLAKDNENQEDYFICGRTMSWFPVALSIAATTISANGFVGGPGWAYHDGLSAFMLMVATPLALVLVCSTIIPFFHNMKVITCYEYLERRLGPKTRTIAACGFLCTATILISSMVYIPALIINTITGWDLRLIVAVTVAVVIIYTLLGGLKAVIWTDMVQMVILWGGLIATFYITLHTLGLGLGDTLAEVKAAGKINPLNFKFDFSVENGFWVSLVGGFILWLQYYATDQSQVQRMLAAKSVRQVKSSLLTGGLVANIMYFIFMIIGLLMYSFHQGKAFPGANNVMIDFMLTQMPVGILGLMIAAVFSAAMSSIAGLLNSLATVFTKDIYERWIDKSGKPASLKTSMLFTGVFGVIVTAFSILGFSGTTASVLKVVGSYTSYLAGSILAVFLLAMFTKKASDAGCFLGFILGVLVTAWAASNTGINWLMYNVVGLVSALAAGYALSLVFADKSGGESGRLEFTLAAQKARIIASGEEMVDGASTVPGKMDKYSYILLGFFLFQYVILAIMQY